MFADLHTHTNYSDGILSPEELIIKAAKAGLKGLAITDHDTIDGYLVGRKFAKIHGIDLISGFELSCYEPDNEYHILAYLVDPENVPLRKHLDEFRIARLDRAEKIVAKLQRMHIPLELESILAKAGNAPVTRPHIASALIDLGFTNSIKEAFLKYLGDGRPAFVPKRYFPVFKAINLIKNAGGISVIAHPAYNVTPAKLSDMINSGIDGIEAYHPMHDPKKVEEYKSIASQYWLLVTGGSDFHGTRPYDDDNFGNVKVPYSYVESMKFHAGRF